MRDHLVALDDRWSLWTRFAVRGAGLPFELVAAFTVDELLTEGSEPEAVERVRAVTADAFWAALADDAFLAALTWQNIAVVDTWAGRLAEQARAGGPRHTTRRNERERVVARYAQRYAAKNESVGFFGAVGWGLVDPDAAGVTWTGGLAPRRATVSFEVWAIRELSRAWADEEPVRPFVPVRLNPACTVRGRHLLRPRRPPLELDADTSAVITAVGDGSRYQRVVTAAAEATGREPAVIADRVETLRAGGAVLVEFPVPFDEWPERHLRDQVTGIPDGDVRALLTGRLDRLDAARERTRAVATDPVRLRAALHALGEEISASGGRSGRTIGPDDLGRSAVYLDCRRDLDVRLGAPAVEELGPPLSVLLNSADWLAAEVADTVSEHLRAAFHTVRARREVVTLADLQTAATEALVPGNRLVAPVLEDFQLRWAEILTKDGAAPTALSVARVRALADVLFPRVEPRWAAARHHTPDLLLYEKPDGTRGWVLGELHVALNTLESRLFATQCDERDELVAASAVDFAAGRIVPVYPPDGAANNSRTYPPPALDPPGVFRYWSFAADSGHEHGVSSTPATAIVVEEVDGELIGVADGWQARVSDFLGEFLTALTVNLFKLRAPSGHAPRVSIGDLVVCRESWRFRTDDVPLPRSRDRDYTYQGLRLWAERQGLPRHVFVRVPHELKPVYVDFAAPALLDNFARLVRAAADRAGNWVEVTEMLPDAGALWMRDHAGLRYTTEFRMVAVRNGPGEPVAR